MFAGTDPSEMLLSEYAGWRVFGEEEYLGLKLVNALSADQKKKAIMSSEVPQDIITAADSGKRLVDYWEIKVSALDKNLQGILQGIIREFVFNLEYDKAVTEYEKILKAGIEKVCFGWIGESEETKAYYYILNGPTFIIEFNNNSGPQNRANHIHAIWREKGNEYGGRCT